MPRTELVLQVFIASPSDVVEERRILVETIDELNALWSNRLGVRLEPVRWETHAYPGFGADAQDVINAALPDGIDLFVGIMWARFGTATGRAESGTVEEFERFLERYRAAPTDVRLMIYFKDAPKPLSEIDTNQLAAINQFRDRVGRDGGLHWRFSSPEDFRTQARLHLSRYVQERTSSRPAIASEAKLVAAASSTEVVKTEPRDDDEMGIFDALEAALEHMTAITDALGRLTQYSEEMSAGVTQRTQELTALNASAPSPNAIGAYKRFANRTADDMQIFVKRTRVELSEFERRLDELFSATTTVASSYFDFRDNDESRAQLLALAEQVDTFGNTLSENAKTTSELRTIIVHLPRMTSPFNRAKRATGDTLEELHRIFVTAALTCQEVTVGIRKLADGAKQLPNPAS